MSLKSGSGNLERKTLNGISYHSAKRTFFAYYTLDLDWRTEFCKKKQTNKQTKKKKTKQPNKQTNKQPTNQKVNEKSSPSKSR
jgi:ribonuclease I